MRIEGEEIFIDDLPTLDPIVAHEQTADGWRALTANGEVLTVSSGNGHTVVVPEGDIVVMQKGKAVGRRAITNDPNINIDAYLRHFSRAAELFRKNENDEALMEADTAVAIVPTTRARFNRAFMLLALGRWSEGFAEYEECERGPPFQRPGSKAAEAAGIKPWRGEDIKGKRLLLIHDHGFGDTIMCLRYVPVLQAKGADVAMLMPPELVRLAGQVGDVTANTLRTIEADYFCPMLLLPHLIATQTPDQILPNLPLAVAPKLVEHRRSMVSQSSGRKIGIAWSVGVQYVDDYPRAIPLDMLVDALDPEAELYSVQAQGADEARACGVRVTEFADFADCAALMSCMDEIITVDTAAVHLAGAIEHPKVTLLLSHWHSWRWLARWYPTVRVCRQQAPGDWASALAQMERA